MAATTLCVASTFSGGGGTGVVYHLMIRKAPTSTAMPATTASGVTHTGVCDTGLRIGLARLAGWRLIRSLW
jgi:spore maturation protein SpmB